MYQTKCSMAVNMEVENSSEDVDAKLLTGSSVSDIAKKNTQKTDLLLSVTTTSNNEGQSIDILVESTNSEQSTKVNQISGESVRGEKLNVIDHLKDNISSNEEVSERILSDIVNSQPTQPALAFTIDFGNNKNTDTTKFQNLFEKYNARHKRNLSASKIEISAKKCGPVLSPNKIQIQNVPSTHSEGYFSNEDDTKRKVDISDKLKSLGSKHPIENSVESDASFSSEQLRYNKLSSHNFSLELNSNTCKMNKKGYWTSEKATTFNDLSRVEACNYDIESEKSYTKNIEYVENNSKSENEEKLRNSIDKISDKLSNINCTLQEYKFDNMTEKDSNLSSISCSVDINTEDASNSNLDVFNVSTADVGSDGAASAAETYTVHKDYTDEEKARMDIDKVFSVGVLTEEESNESYVHNFKMSVSRDNNMWISEWATQVAEHNSLPPAIGGSTGRTSPLTPTKIPSPIYLQRSLRNRCEQSDSSLDTESYLRVKERIVVTNQHTLIDSGGESDDDTSNSYNTPPHSCQRTPVHTGSARRSSLSESLFKRINANENRRSGRKYFSQEKPKYEDTTPDVLSSPSRAIASCQLGRRSSSLDRKECASNTTESNISRKDKLKYQEEDSKHTNSLSLSHLRSTTSRLTNSPIVSRKTTTTKNIHPSALERNKNPLKTSPAKNVGYFTCVENSPYMLRKSNSTSNYHETGLMRNRDQSPRQIGDLKNDFEFQAYPNIQRSASNANVRSSKPKTAISRHSSFNANDIGTPFIRGKYQVVSDSSSETGDYHTKSSALPISSGIKLNRTFSIRRSRLTCESDTTPNTTPEERRRRSQVDVKSLSAPIKQQSYHRNRTSSVGSYSKELLKKSESVKPRTPSISRTDTGRSSMRAPKNSFHGSALQRPNPKATKDHKKSIRSNSTLTSKEVEFQNWKRRTSYDPMKAAAEGRKKIIDGSRKLQSTEDSSGNPDSSVLRSASFHGTGGVLSLADDWSDNENIVDNHGAPPCSPRVESDSDLETSSYLKTTQNVVSAMSARITVYRPQPADSDGETDEDTSHSLHQNTSKVHPGSDTESSDERHPIVQSPFSNTKHNRALSLRRNRLDSPSLRPSTTSVKTKNVHESRAKSETTPSISRTDSGRFSMRASRASNITPKSKLKLLPNTKEVEMQNWTRRKSYDPMKAAMEGRRKANLAKLNASSSLSPSHVARSQSFHGHVGLANNWSDDELLVSADDTLQF
ncbi:serine-rich adhesin for platelets-like isoform X2 [Prorops nasuta]|uniref:serine-rich adhesin for platelets-like isoform X2 n=1 Tax=Prorops nasuta TaxID=863751 RepID=UPI0034CE104D